MLKKSFQAALIMSSLTFLSTLFTFVFLERLYNPIFKNTTTETFIGKTSNDAIILFFAIIIMFLLIVLPGAFYIRNWSDVYFGMEGAVRWILFGVIFGCLVQLRGLIPDATLDKGFSSFLIEKGISAGVGLIFIYASHFLAFKLLRKKR